MRANSMPARLPVLAIALVMGGAVSALAQGTPEQREACTPDAVRLCSDTIPDVGRTRACIASHRDELSPRCRAAFDDAAPAAKPRTRVARMSAAPRTAEPVEKAEMPRRQERMAVVPPPARHRHFRAVRADRDTREARRVINRLCATNILGGDTCGFMGKVLTLAE